MHTMTEGRVRAAEAAQILGVTQADVYRLVEQGELAAWRPGRQPIELDRATVEAYRTRLAADH